MTYDPKTYWNTREEPNLDGQITAGEWDWIFKSIPVHASVIDFGPGVGRTFGYYSHTSKVTGIDISAKYAERAKKAASDYKFEYEHIVIDSLDEVEVALHDVAVCIRVLQHVPEDQIVKVIKWLIGHSQMQLIINDIPFGDPAPHMFKHEYMDILRSIGIDNYTAYHEKNNNFMRQYLRL